VFLESQWKRKEYNVIGLDEVGRGPLAGPVVAAGAYFSGSHKQLEIVLEELKKLKVTDSKKLSSKKRLKIISELGQSLESLHAEKRICLFSGQIEIYLFECAAELIDEINILQASLLAMKTCAERLASEHKAKAFFDGNKIPKDMAQNVECESIVKGDSKSALIGLASIFAKEYRDSLMEKYAADYPGYGFEKHAGYPTKMHLEAIKTYGVSPLHRKTFKGVREYI